MSKSYKELQVYRISFDLFVDTHRFSMRLPKYERFELGSQLRRSADSVNSNIVEGYGRRFYKKDFIKFLIYSVASNDETINHLQKITVIYPNLSDEARQLINRYTVLGKQLYRFVEFVRLKWKS